VQIDTEDADDPVDVHLRRGKPAGLVYSPVISTVKGLGRGLRCQVSRHEVQGMLEFDLKVLGRWGSGRHGANKVLQYGVRSALRILTKWSRCPDQLLLSVDATK
jgi:hypothetical protein